MTRTQFAAEVQRFFGQWAKDIPVIEYLTKSMSDPIYHSIADIATNGFDQDDNGEPMVVLRGQAANAYAKTILVEQSQESAKRSRPFVGSHKLPHDTDWD